MRCAESVSGIGLGFGCETCRVSPLAGRHQIARGCTGKRHV
jgi:hypothetical protein